MVVDRVANETNHGPIRYTQSASEIVVNKKGISNQASPASSCGRLLVKLYTLRLTVLETNFY